MKAVTLRRATPDDIGAIIRLNGAGNGQDVAIDMQVVFDNGGMAASDYAVADVGGRVVATVGLLAMTLRVGPVCLPVGQPEFIATDPDYQGRGLARRLLEKVQEWAHERGDLVEIIGGIAYFYRQYGYSYGMPRPPELLVPPEDEITLPSGWQVRPAGTVDVDPIRALQANVERRVDVALPFTDNLWPSFLVMPGAPLLVATSEGHVGAVGRLRIAPGSLVHVQALAADGVDGLRAVLAVTQARYPGASLVVAEREGSVVRAVVGPRASPVAGRKWYYARVPSLARVLTALIPVLDQRLARSAFADASGEVDISLYRSAVRLGYEKGRIVAVAPRPAIHEPDEDGAVGIPPDLVPKLLFGEGGAVALADDPDVFLGRFRPLMACLFPPLRVDLQVW